MTPIRTLHGSSRRRVATGAAFLFALVILAMALARGDSRAAQAEAQPSADTLAGLAQAGEVFVPATTDDRQQVEDSGGITDTKAMRVALDQYAGGKAPASGSVHAYLGRLTEENRLGPAPADTPGDAAGDTPSPPPAVNRLAYAVQIQGLNLYPQWGPADSTQAHHELIVFIDAKTGEEIVATSFR